MFTYSKGYPRWLPDNLYTTTFQHFKCLIFKICFFWMLKWHINTPVSEMHTYFTLKTCPITRQHFGSRSVLFDFLCWCYTYQFGKDETSLTVAKFNHSYSNSPAVFKEFNNVKELSNWLRNAAVMVPCANWHAQYVRALFRLCMMHLLSVHHVETITNAHVHTLNLLYFKISRCTSGFVLFKRKGAVVEIKK